MLSRLMLFTYLLEGTLGNFHLKFKMSARKGAWSNTAYCTVIWLNACSSVTVCLLVIWSSISHSTSADGSVYPCQPPPLIRSPYAPQNYMQPPANTAPPQAHIPQMVGVAALSLFTLLQYLIVCMFGNNFVIVCLPAIEGMVSWMFLSMCKQVVVSVCLYSFLYPENFSWAICGVV